MKAIIIKHNEKVLFVAKIDDVSTKQFLELQKSAIQNLLEKDLKVASLQNHIIDLEENVKELNAKVNYLGKQIAIDRGEIEEDDENEYEFVIKTNGLEEPEQYEELVEEPSEESEEQE